MSARRDFRYYLNKAIELSVREDVAAFGSIDNPKKVFNLLEAESYLDTEHFFVITLNGARVPIKKHLISKGIANRTLVHPREVFIKAIEDMACAIVIAHNHPSGNIEPSDDDKLVTKRMMDAGKLIGIDVIDHVIVSRGGFNSAKENGWS